MTKKESILKAGAKLFAKRSYDSVGIRDIANEAGVNSAMISYYFGGKVGLLREIFLQFDALIRHECTASLEKATGQQELITLFVNGVLDSARDNLDVYLVGLKELNHDSEELQDLRNALHEKSEAVFVQHIGRLGISVSDDQLTRHVGFTAILGMIFSDYLLGGCCCVGNDELFEMYKKTIIDMLHQGLPGYWS